MKEAATATREQNIELLKARLDGSAYGLANPNHPKEPTTMQVNQAKLARRLGLPANSHESTIRARLAGVEVEREVRATRASLASVSGPRLDPATIRASSDAELRQLARSGLTSAEREAVAEELAHREFMARSYPADRSTGGARIHHYS